MLTHGIMGLREDMRTAEAAGYSSYWVAQVGLIDALTVIGVGALAIGATVLVVAPALWIARRGLRPPVEASPTAAD